MLKRDTRRTWERAGSTTVYFGPLITPRVDLQYILDGDPGPRMEGAFEGDRRGDHPAFRVCAGGVDRGGDRL